MDIVKDFIILGVSFLILFKCADIFVGSASSIAVLFGIPKIIIGIILVSLATTSPEFTVSIIAAYRGQPEIALGNALGSVICDDGLALALAAILAPTFILIDRDVLRTAGTFLISVAILVYLLALNGTVGRLEGLILLSLLLGYFVFLIRNEQKRRKIRKKDGKNTPGTDHENRATGKISHKKIVFKFLFGLAGIIIASHFIVDSATDIARIYGISEAVIGLTIVAFGTSLPEISTCISAARHGEGQIAAGNIIGADILNILWIVGMSSMVNPMHVETKFINFTFPWMLIIVTTMLVCMRIRYSLSKVKGYILLTLYILFMGSSIFLFYIKQ